MNLNTNILENSFNLIAPNGVKITEKFYKILFDKHPELKALFNNDNSHRLLEGLATIVKNLNNEKQLVVYLQQLGKRHAGYGIKEAHYPMVAEALLLTLEEFAKEAWTSDTKQAWVEAYNLIQSTMLQGATMG